MADSILPFEALFNEAAMSAADAAKKCGFSRASGFEDFRDRFVEQLAVGSRNVLGVGIAIFNLPLLSAIRLTLYLTLHPFNRSMIKM